MNPDPFHGILCDASRLTQPTICATNLQYNEPNGPRWLWNHLERMWLIDIGSRITTGWLLGELGSRVESILHNNGLWSVSAGGISTTNQPSLNHGLVYVYLRVSR